MALTPTLTLWKYYLRHDRLSMQEQMANTAIGQLRVWLACGGDVLFGNDLGAVEYDPSDEYALMAEAGMSFRQILASLTTAPAARFGESQQLGRVAVGLDADLVVLKEDLQEDPSQNLRALSEVRYTVRAGKIVYAAQVCNRSIAMSAVAREKAKTAKAGGFRIFGADCKWLMGAKPPSLAVLLFWGSENFGTWLAAGKPFRIAAGRCSAADLRLPRSTPRRAYGSRLAFHSIDCPPWALSETNLSSSPLLFTLPL